MAWQRAVQPDVLRGQRRKQTVNMAAAPWRRRSGVVVRVSDARGLAVAHRNHVSMA